MILQSLLLLLSTFLSSNGMTLIDSAPPKPSQVALMGRYIIHNSDWISVSTISTLTPIKTYPFVNLKSTSDGPISQGTGIPYLYVTRMDLTGSDIEKDNRCSVLASLAQSAYCTEENFDPQDPRCARVILSGHIVRVDTKTEEYNFARNSLYSRHPEMKEWPLNHDFYIAKVNIEQVAVLDYIGQGVKYVSVEDYLNANSTYWFENTNYI